jgi:pSer/pThr/pTyr-binding forkhead associated (FHA) protein
MRKRWLVFTDAAGEDREFSLTQSACQLGRGSGADIRLDSKKVSQLHATLLSKPEGVSLLDLDSTNGTFVNGKKVQRAELQDGDQVRLADITFRFREAEAAEDPVAAADTTQSM